MIIPGATKMLRVRLARIPLNLTDSIIFTLNKSQSEATPTLQKRYERDGSGAVKYIQDCFCIPLSQEDTLLFNGAIYIYVEAQVNLISGSVIKIPGPRRCVGSTLATEIIEGNAPDLHQEDYFEMTISEAIYINTSENKLQIADSDTLGGIKVGKNLIISEDGTLSVDTASAVQQDNTKPVTSGAVYLQIGNIEALLNTI